MLNTETQHGGSIQKPVRVIRPYGRNNRSLLRDFYEARHMFWNMVRTSALLPYKDMLFGVIWTMVRPLVFLLVLVFIKNRSGADMGTKVEYELFVFSGIISWWYFSDAASGSAKAIYNHRSIITKMYFPRVIIPVMPVVVRAFDWGMQFIALVVLMLLFGRLPDMDFWLLPISIINLMLLALAVGYIFAVLSTYFRDVQPILANALYVGLFVSPVIYSTSLVPERFHIIYKILNPAVGPLDNLRAGLFGSFPPDYEGLVLSWIVTTLLLIIGIYAFRQIEDDLPERVL